MSSIAVGRVWQAPQLVTIFHRFFTVLRQGQTGNIFLGARWLTFLLYEKCGQASRFLLFHVWSLNFLLFQVKDQRDPIPAANPTAPWRLKRCSEEQKKWWVWNSSFVTLDQVLESSLMPKFLYSLDFFKIKSLHAHHWLVISILLSHLVYRLAIFTRKVQSTTKTQRIATHSHIKGLGLAEARCFSDGEKWW